MAVRLGELLLRDKRISPVQLQEALNHQRINGGRLGSNLVKLGFVQDEDITTILSRQYGVPAIALAQFDLDPAVVRLISTDQLVAVINVPAEQMNHLPIGGNVRVQLANARRLVTAKVYSVAPAIDGESGTVQVRILLPNPDGDLRAGDRCSVTVGPVSLRTAQRLVNLLAIFCVLGWRIFWLTMLNRSMRHAAPTLAFTRLEIDLLNRLSTARTQANARTTTSLNLCLKQLARLGGFLARARDGPPGNIVMWRGLSRLTDIEIGYRLAKQDMGN